MGKVSLNINGRAYGLGCEDGEEERLMRLGQKLDDRVAAMANQFGQIGDLRLLVMAGITLLDELDDVSGNIDNEVERRVGQLQGENERVLKSRQKTEVEAAESLMSAAERIERLAQRLSDASSKSK